MESLSPEPHKEGPLQDALNKEFEAQVARELRRRRRLMAIFVLALVIPLFAAGLALVRNKSEREQSSRQLVTLVHQQVSASLPSAVDSTYLAYTPKLEKTIMAGVASEVEKQTNPKLMDFLKQFEKAQQAQQKQFQDQQASRYYALARPPSPDYAIRDSAADRANLYVRQVVANARQLDGKLQSIEKEVGSRQLAKMVEQLAMLSQRQQQLEYQLASFRQTALRAIRRDSLAIRRDSLFMKIVDENLQTLTPKKLRKQGRALKRNQKRAALNNPAKTK